MRELLVVVLVLACPLMMILMMRGGHGHGGHAHEPRADEPRELSTESLHRLRADVDVLIAEREQAERHGDETELLRGAKR
jgi:hypothetical protein